MGVSLADSSVTSSTPGVLVKGTVDPAADTATGLYWVVNGSIDTAAIDDVIDPGYISGGGTAYWSQLRPITDGRMIFSLSDRTGVADSPNVGPQFTESAEDSIHIVLFYGSTSAAWEFAELDDSDETEPYLFSAASVTAAGPTIDTALINAINADSTVIAMLVDGSHPNIDIDALEIADPPEAPDAPTVTSTGTSSISVALSADPTSDSPITSRDVRHKKTSESDSAWVEVLDVTSPVAVTGLDDGDEYEAQWRANSGGVVDTIAITAGGTGYTFIPTVTITGGGGTGATATAVISGRGGSVTAINITDGGSGYTSAPTVTITGGGGTGATATATFFEAQNGAWSDSGTARTDLADLMPTVGAIDDVTVEQGEDLDETLPEATGGDLPITYSMTRLASWMSFDAATRRLTGTAPGAVSSTTVVYTATDTDGDTASREFTINVPLALANFDTDGLETEALALVEALRQGTNSYVWSRSPHNEGDRGVLVDGEMGIDDDNIPVNAIRFRTLTGSSLGNGRISIEARNIPGYTGNLRNYFTSADGAGRDLTLHVQSSTHSLSFGVRTHNTRHGTDWIRWDLSATDEQAVLASISNGERFIFALTRPAVSEPHAPAAPTVTPLSVTEARVTWVAPTTGDTPDSYDLQYKRTAADDTEWNIDNDVTSPETLIGLFSGHEYEVQVRGVNSAGAGPWSLSGTATLPEITLSIAAIDDISLTYPDSLDVILPFAMGGLGVAMYTLTPLASWMTFDDAPSVRRLTGTPPNVDSSTTLTYTATASEGDMQTASRMFTVTVTALDPQDATANAGLEVDLSVSATATQESPDPQNATADAGLEVDLSVSASATVQGGTQQATADADLEIDLSVSATATQDSPNPQSASADAGLDLDFSVSATATQQSPDPQEATAAPDLEVDLSVAATATQVSPDPQDATADAGLGVDFDVSATAQVITPDPPEIEDIDDYDTLHGVSTPITLPEATNTTGTVTYLATGLPPGLSFDSATRRISGIPDTLGTYTVTYTATDQLESGSTQFDIAVLNEVSLDNQFVVNSLPGIALKGTTDPTLESNTLARVVWSPEESQRITQRIDREYMDGEATRYLTAFTIGETGGLLAVDTQADNSDPGQISDTSFSASGRAALAIVVFAGGSSFSWVLSLLLADDTTDPHNIADSRFTSAGDIATLANRQTIGNASEATVLLVDRNNPNIDYSNLRYSPHPEIPDIDDIELEHGAVLNETLDASIGVNVGITYSVEGLPSWASFDPATRVLSGTAPDAHGEWELTYRATDINGDDDTETFSLRVLLGLADFNDVGLEVDVIGMFTPGQGQTRDIWSRPPRGNVGTLHNVDGTDLDYGVGSNPINYIRYESGSNRWTMFTNDPEVDMSYFRSGGDGNDLTLYLLTTDASVDFPLSASTGGSTWLNTTVPSEDRSFCQGLVNGTDRFIMALARPDVQDATSEADFEIDLSVSAAATQVAPDAQEATADAGLEVDLSVSATATQQGPDPQQASADAGLGIALSVSATATQEDAGNQEAAADAGLEIDLSVSATATQESPDGQDASADAGLEINLSVSATATFSIAAPGAPTISAVSPASATSLQVVWTAPTDDGGEVPTQYDLQIRRGNSGTWMLDTNVTSPHTISGLLNGVEYQVRVRALNSGGTGPWSTIARGTPEETSVRAPNQGDLVLTVGRAIDIVLATGTGGDPPLTHSLSPTSLPGGLTYESSTGRLHGTPTAVGETDYTYTVTDNGGVTASVTFSIIVRPARRTFAWQIQIDWDGDGRFANSLSDVTQYVVSDIAAWRGRKFAGSVYAELAAGSMRFSLDNSSGVFNNLSTTQALASKVVPIHRIRLRVSDGEVHDMRGKGVGTLASAESAISGRPAAPDNLMATVDDGEVDLSWDALGDTDVTSFEVQRRRGLDDPGEWEEIENSDDMTTAVTVAPLINDREYAFRVRAVSANGAGPASAEVDAIPTSDYRTVWAGYVNQFVPDPKQGGNDILKTEAFGTFYYLRRTPVSTPPEENVPISEAVRMVLTIAGLTREQIGDIDSVVSLSQWWVTFLNGITALQELEETEGGVLYESADGLMSFASIYTRHLTSLVTAAASFSDDASANTIDLHPASKVIEPSRQIANVIRVPVRQTMPGEEQTLWQATQTYRVSASDSIRLVVGYDGGVSEWHTTLVGDTDYQANSMPDGSGDNVTDSLTITTTASGDDIVLELENTSSEIIWVTMLRIRGRPLIIDTSYSVEVRNQDSIDLYDEQVYELRRRTFFTDSDSAFSYGDFRLSQLADPPRRVEAVFWGHGQLDFVKNLEVNDKIDVKIREVTHEMFVEAARFHIARDNTMETTLYLSPLGTFSSDIFILDQGRLGTNTLGR